MGGPEGSSAALGENPAVLHSPHDDDPYTFSGKVRFPPQKRKGKRKEGCVRDTVSSFSPFTDPGQGMSGCMSLTPPSTDPPTPPMGACAKIPPHAMASGAADAGAGTGAARAVGGQRRLPPLAGGGPFPVLGCVCMCFGWIGVCVCVRERERERIIQTHPNKHTQSRHVHTSTHRGVPAAALLQVAADGPGAAAGGDRGGVAAEGQLVVFW